MGSRGNSRSPSQQLVCFPPYATHREWELTISRHFGGENTLPRSYAIQKHKNVPFLSFFFKKNLLFKNGQRSSGAWRFHEGVGWIGTRSREWKCSVMAECECLVVIRGHLFLSDHKASDFSHCDRWISGSELDKRGHAPQWNALTMRHPTITCSKTFFSDRPDLI